MLSFLRMKNFMSVAEATLNFSFAEGKAPNGYRESSNIIFCEPAKKQRLVPVMAIYGPNASGKTNIIRAIYALRKIALGSKAANFYSPNRLLMPSDPMTLTCGFCVGNRSFVYDVTISYAGITEEALSCDGIDVFRIAGGQCHFDGLTTTQVYTADRVQEIFQMECMREGGNQNKSFLSRLGDDYWKLSDVATVAHRYLSAMEIYTQNKIPMFFGIEKIQNISKDTFDNSLAEVVGHLRQFDISIEGLRVDQKEFESIQQYVNDQLFSQADDIQKASHGPGVVAKVIRSFHKDIDGNLVKFHFSEESDGTKILAGLLGVVLSVLKKGGVLVIDELDRSLHPYILEKLVCMFKDKDYNQKNAQLVFSAHDTDLLDTDTVRMSEVAIADKTMRKGTSITRIAEFEGVRNVTNFRRQYLLGTFGGIPHPYI